MNKCEFCGWQPGSRADEGCLIVRTRFICEDCFKKKIFVFGSNLAGRHGKGAALTAVTNYGAKYGVGVGRTGNAYAIPTKDRFIQPLHLKLIEPYAKEFVEYAKSEPTLPFFLTRVGCGLRGLTDSQMAPMFKGIPSNVIAPDEWRSFVYEIGGTI